jgi:hypothetical protein
VPGSSPGNRGSTVAPDQDLDTPRPGLSGLIDEAALIELRVEKHRPPFVDHQLLLARFQAVQALEDANHG